MTIYEASERYNIPLEILREGSWQYDDSDLERLSLIMTLHDIGFASYEIENYMKLLEKGQETGTECMRILIKKHNAMLDEIHLREKQLDRLNYLRYEIQKKNSSRD